MLVTQPRNFSAVYQPAINETEQMLYDRLNRDLRVACSPFNAPSDGN